MKFRSIALIVPAILLSTNTYAAKILLPMPKNYQPSKSSPYDSYPIHPSSLFADDTQSEEITQGVHFFSLALQTWNPSLNPNDVERIISRHIENQGLMKGLIEPALALIDTAYAAGRPEFGNMLNPMLKQISAPLAQSLHLQFGLPLDFNGKSFSSVTKLNDRDILSSMQKVLGDEFKKNQPQSSTIRDNSDFMAEAILGNNSFLCFASRNLYPHQMHKDENSTEQQGYQPKQDFTSTPRQNNNAEDAPKKSFAGKSDWSSTPRSSNEEHEERPKGLFSKMDLVSMSGPCAAKCIDSISTTAASGAGIGFVLGKQLGAVAGVVVGAIGGGYVCSQSTECKGTEPKKQDPPKTEPKPDETPKDNPPKTTGTNDPSPPKENTDTDPTPKTSDPGTPTTPKEPDSNDSDSDSSKKDGIVYTSFINDQKNLGFDLEKKKKDFKHVSTPMRGN